MRDIIDKKVTILSRLNFFFLKGQQKNNTNRKSRGTHLVQLNHCGGV